MEENLKIMEQEGINNGKKAQIVQMENLEGIDLKKVFDSYQKSHDLQDCHPIFGQKQLKSELYDKFPKFVGI